MTTPNPKDGLYHKLIGFPANVLTPFLNKTLALLYSRHALSAAMEDQYGVPSLPKTLTIRANQVIELETEAGRVKKLVIRIPYDSNRDLVLVVIPETFDARVKTVWFNKTNDQHRTLRRELYVKP